MDNSKQHPYPTPFLVITLNGESAADSLDQLVYAPPGSRGTVDTAQPTAQGWVYSAVFPVAGSVDPVWVYLSESEIDDPTQYTVKRGDNNTPLWTVESCKTLLPGVQVKLGTITLPGTLSGRKAKFANVRVPVTIIHGKLTAETELNFTYAWETVCHSLNENVPLGG